MSSWQVELALGEVSLKALATRHFLRIVRAQSFWECGLRPKLAYFPSIFEQMELPEQQTTY